MECRYIRITYTWTGYIWACFLVLEGRGGGEEGAEGHRGYIGSGKSVLWLSGERSGGGGRVEEGATDGRKRNSHTAPVDPIRSNSSMLADFVRPPACSGTPGPTCSEKDFMQIIGGEGVARRGMRVCVCIPVYVCMYVCMWICEGVVWLSRCSHYVVMCHAA